MLNCIVSFVVHFRLNLELRDNEGRVPLWLALSRDTRVDPMDEDSLAAKLVKHGASPDAINNITGERSLFGPSVFKMIHTIIVSVQIKKCRTVSPALPGSVDCSYHSIFS